MTKIVIVGAGLTGISTAYHLEKNGFFDYKIFEKEREIGGLCRSAHKDGFTFDYTGHLLHASDDYFRGLLDEVVGLHNMHNIARRSFIYSKGVYTKYPFQINLKGLPSDVISDCISGFASRGKHNKNVKSFDQWVLKNFGAGIAKHFFLPFQKKILAHDLKDVTPSWTQGFVPKTSIKEMINGAVNDSNVDVGYNSQFYYPKSGGIISWVDKFASKLKTKINKNKEITELRLSDKEIIFADGSFEKYDILINTMPLDTLVERIKDKPSTTLRCVSGKLVCNSVVNFNLGINQPDVTSKHWVYYPENKFPFYRVGFPHNFSNGVVPSKCSSLYGEFSHCGASKAKVETLTKKSISAVKSAFKIDDAKIKTEHIIHLSHAYVIYNFWREKNLHKLLHALEENGVHSIGRYGGWKYSSMQDAVLDGKQVSEKLLVKPARRTSLSERKTTKKIKPSTKQIGR